MTKVSNRRKVKSLLEHRHACSPQRYQQLAWTFVVLKLQFPLLRLTDPQIELSIC